MNTAIAQPATTNLTARSSEPSLSDGLKGLLDSGNSQIVGPKTAAEIRAYLDGPWPELALPTSERVDNMIGRIAIATKERRLTAEEHKERLEIYWRVLREVPLIDLAAGFDKILATYTFMPTPAEVLKVCSAFTAKREYRRSRAKHLLFMHEREYRNPTHSDDMADVDDVAALRAQAGRKYASSRL